MLFCALKNNEMISFGLDNLEKFVAGPNFFGYADGCKLMLLGGVGGMAVVVVDFGDINP